MITSRSTAHVLNNRLGYWNQLTKIKPFTNSTLWQSTLNKQSHLQMALLLPLCVLLVNQRLLHWLPSRNVPSPCHEATVISTGHTHTIYPAFYSVLPRPFLQGATPCPFLVTPCLFKKSRNDALPFFPKKFVFVFGWKRLIMLVAFSSVCSFLLSTHSVDCSSFIVRSPH